MTPQAPDLILINLDLDVARLVSLGRRVRERSELLEEIPVVISGVASLEEGAEVDAGSNVPLPRPDNFDQLRGFLIRLQRPSAS